MRFQGKRIAKFILSGGGCFAIDSGVLKHKVREMTEDIKEEFMEKMLTKEKKTTIRDIKEARGIRVVPVETHDYWDDYTWDDDEATLCSPLFFIRLDPAPRPSVEPLPEPSTEQPAEFCYQPVLIPVPEHEPESEPDFTLVPAPQPKSTLPSESTLTLVPHAFKSIDDQPEHRSDPRIFTSSPSQELASRNPDLYRLQLDEQEHDVFRSLMGPDLFLSPIQNPRRILCTGPGTVSWAIEVAEMFPEAEVLCLDPSPYPRLMPRNCHVESLDVRSYSPEDGWDFVYIRCTRSAIYWPRIVERSQAITRIGGWIEMVDLERPSGPICTCRGVLNTLPERRCAVCESFPAIVGREFWLGEVGFDHVHQEARAGQPGAGDSSNLECITLHGRVLTRPAPTPPNSQSSSLKS